MLALVVIVASVTAILLAAGAVLSVEGEELGLLASRRASSGDIAEAIGAGVALPHFFAKEDFDAAMARRNSADGARLTDAELSSLEATVSAIRDWAIFREVKRAFRRFVGVFVGAVAAIGLAGILVLASLDAGPGIEVPTPVAVEVLAGDALAGATGCTDPSATVFVAIGGRLSAPLLDPHGTGCRPGATWRPKAEEAEITYAG